MSDKTKIEWADATLNVVTGCTRVSPGCDHCYIEATPPFRIERRRFDGPGVGSSTGVRLHPERLEKLHQWLRPRRIFLNSLGDLFHDDVPDGFIAWVWHTMALTPRHTYMILTKRHARMRSWVSRWADTTGDDTVTGPGGILPRMPYGPAEIRETYSSPRAHLFADMLEAWGEPPPGAAYPFYDWAEGPRFWPSILPNVWLGVSVEDQARANLRVPVLLDTPAAVHFLSCEPLLGPVNLNGWLLRWACVACGYRMHDPATVEFICPSCRSERGFDDAYGRIDWVIAGGESGHRARPMHPTWARALRDDCAAAGTAFHFKQLGTGLAREMGLKGKGSDLEELPEDLRVRDYPKASSW